ncbi:glucuronate isomerase [Roseivivax isoporae]|uniref:Uronate isomerase n=1 Tax=Roseivivax isoporae LMG 25204 TaxID=1449351 RepID=X7F5K9_9RHOB|nr:glucuronate isomerase [Roseivivax isoporae]ETX28055.1 glucuronate isomerase [Roseivivax isoporae LMG 25204]
MTRFLNDDFLLDTGEARRLFHEVARDLPIIDYHNHLPPAEIAEDLHWSELGTLWLGHDHYKWRVMRWAGIEERLVTGDADPRDKFDAFARAMPRMIGNPVHHWSHLELWRYFDLDGTVLSAETADRVWDVTRERLAQPDFGAQGLLTRMKVELVGTTDDPLDTLEHHAALRGAPWRVVPTFRPDPAVKIDAAGFSDWVARLEAATHPIRGFDDLVGALETRLDHFVAHGCRAADHGIDRLDAGAEVAGATLDAALDAARAGRAVAADDAASWRAALFVALGRAYARRGLVMQLHVNALRNTRTRLLDAAGRDAGADSIRDIAVAEPLNALLDRLDRTEELPRMVIYGLDPTRNPAIVTTAGNFQDGSVPGKVQAGTAWWFNDQLDGMEDQIRTLSQMGLISTFLGMLTDSRSFLSFPRHEYFRRLFCRIVGRWQVEGHVPDAPDMLDALVRDVCYRNARDWFAAPGAD